MKTKWGIVTNDGKYIADPTGRTDLMAWTYDKEEAEKLATLHNGKVVDVEQFVEEYNEHCSCGDREHPCCVHPDLDMP